MPRSHLGVATAVFSLGSRVSSPSPRGLGSPMFLPAQRHSFWPAPLPPTLLLSPLVNHQPLVVYALAPRILCNRGWGWL